MLVIVQTRHCLVSTIYRLISISVGNRTDKALPCLYNFPPITDYRLPITDHRLQFKLPTGSSSSVFQLTNRKRPCDF